jgi:hypothetical protein
VNSTSDTEESAERIYRIAQQQAAADIADVLYKLKYRSTMRSATAGQHTSTWLSRSGTDIVLTIESYNWQPYNIQYIVKSTDPELTARLSEIASTTNGPANAYMQAVKERRVFNELLGS